MSIIDALASRSPREQWLLAVLVGAVGPLAIGFGVLLPLSEAKNIAGLRLQEARELNIWVAARAGDASQIAAQTTAPAGGAEGPAIGLSGIEKSLVAVGIRPAASRLEASAAGDITLEFDVVDFVSIMRWLDGQNANWGYAIATMRIEKTDRPSLVRAALTLKPN